MLVFAGAHEAAPVQSEVRRIVVCVGVMCMCVWASSVPSAGGMGETCDTFSRFFSASVCLFQCADLVLDDVFLCNVTQMRKSAADASLSRYPLYVAPS